MSDDSVTIRLGRTLHAAARDLARMQDISLGQLLRDALAREIGRAERGARPPVRADERLVAPLRARLAPILAEAPTWTVLLHRLQREEGVTLVEAGGGLAVLSFPDRQRLCKASELGFSYARLMRRIGAPFPGHSHTWLFEKAGQGEQPKPLTRRVPRKEKEPGWSAAVTGEPLDPEAEDVILIEPD
ncbi:hypothetical protein [Histidinibacterium lentulum]|uniref:hypothetical protein n=1 Tax=Histidinibacterium lentulum TaxID=2480588 RepID=UPI00160BAB01|nr:hypothetical protein [Histidinibacterium lentulum]